MAGSQGERTDAARVAVPDARPARTGLIALAVPHLEEPYFAELSSRIVRGAEERGMAVLIVQTEGEHSREVDVANGVGLPAIDGLIHIPRSLTVADLTRRTSPGPLVLLGEHIEVSPFTHITINNRDAMRTATEHLLATGCRRIAFVGRRDVRPSDAADERHAGYLEALANAGVGADPQLTVQVDAFTSGEGERAVRSLATSVPDLDGVVCANDSVALGALAALHSLGLRVPESVSVVGIDDILAAQFSVPALSSVSPDHDALVASAFAELERQLTAPLGADLPVRHVTIPASLVKRASTAR